MPWMVAAAAGASVLGGMIGAAESAADREQALKMHQDAIKAWLDLQVPNPVQQKLLLERYIQTGRLTPELEQQVQQDASQFEQIKTDPRFKEAQLQALGQMQEIGKGGLTLSDRAANEKALSDIEAQDRGRREAILQQYGARGLGGSGLELQAQMMAQQQATNRASQQQLDMLGSARDRALNAIIQSGDLGGKLRGQEFDEQSKVAAARDAINRFNTQNKQDVLSRNVGIKNAAQQYNLDRQQQIANANVELGNKEQQYNKELLQQQFQNKAQIAAGKSGQYRLSADALNQSADRTANKWAGIGDAVNKGFSTIGVAEMKKKSGSTSDDDDLWGADWNKGGNRYV